MNRLTISFIAVLVFVALVSALTPPGTTAVSNLPGRSQERMGAAGSLPTVNLSLDNLGKATRPGQTAFKRGPALF